MSRVGRGEAIATGITKYATRYRVVAAVGRRQRETSFPLGTALDKMRAWQLTEKAELLGEQPIVHTGTLSADVPRFLATIAGKKTRQYHLTNLMPWVSLYGHLPRTAITSVLLRRALATWQTETRLAIDPHTKEPTELPPYAANTLNHRLSSLRRLYAVLDADDERAINPCVRVPKLETPQPEPREIPRPALELLFAALPVHRYKGQGPEAIAAIYAAATAPKANKSAIAKQYGMSETAVRKIIDRKGASERATLAASRIRLEVKRTTGLPWKQIGAITAAHLRLASDPDAPIGGQLWVTPRRKGKGTPGRWLPLSREGAAAVQQLLAHCPGAFSPSSVYKFFQRHLAAVLAAAKQAGIVLPPLPPNLRPYDLRHTFLTQVERAGRNRKATQGLGLHAHASTADRYSLGAAVDGEEAALTALMRRGQAGPG